MMTEDQLRKGCELIWRKGDMRHESVIRVTQITKNMVRSVSVTPSEYQKNYNLAPKKSFWNPKSFILDECTPVSASAESTK